MVWGSCPQWCPGEKSRVGVAGQSEYKKWTGGRRRWRLPALLNRLRRQCRPTEWSMSMLCAFSRSIYVYLLTFRGARRAVAAGERRATRRVRINGRGADVDEEK